LTAAVSYYSSTRSSCCMLRKSTRWL
jgi:hypothetical protein